MAGQGGTAWHKKYYTPDEKNACPRHPYDPFYIAITPAEAALADDGPFVKKPNDPCVVKTCLKFEDNSRENCEGEACARRDRLPGLCRVLDVCCGFAPGHAVMSASFERGPP